MDPYSLKRDNRKKFQDKQRLKNRHATPSDRKYRTLNYQEKQRQEEEAKDPEEGEEPKPSNDYRYHEDISLAFENPMDLERDSDAKKKARKALRARAANEEPLLRAQSSEEALTTKGLHAMGVDGLNDLLGAKAGHPAANSASASNRAAKTTVKSAAAPGKKPTVKKSMIPDELVAEQDFLDDLL